MSIISEIARIEKAYFSDAWSEASLEETFKHEHNHLVAVFDDGSTADDFVFQGREKLAGYLIFSENSGDAELLRIAVDPDMRRQGYGGKLMEHFITSLEFMNTDKVTLEVREGNEAAINLYTIYGFEKIAVRKDYYFNPDEDAVIMQRPIAKNADQLDLI
ncbi:MAG: ribosomal protein S18-alanine N-acetyltransferase [Eubacterium sp.]|jgi:ribosomal-protein-alanine N-acetyltransferase|nr:ribosomal protein S18-alanine N-acetyltransferase [Eubacterium sp.]